MSNFHQDIARAIFDYYARSRGEGHTSMLASAIARELIYSAPKCGVHVWMWSMKEAQELNQQVLSLLGGPDGDSEHVELIDRVRYFSAVAMPNSAGQRAPAFVDNHVVIELCIAVDQAHEEIKRTKANAYIRESHLKSEISELKSALDVTNRANDALWWRRKELESQVEQLAGENALLAALLEEEGIVL